ncbi:MAG: tetratricopeptide repeat protein [Victivallaceae bacterium]|nr:tetratricopeptide repeat protein [Victivallaceae bacterium]
MKKLIILLCSVCTLLAFGALVYFIFIYQSVADYLDAARTAMAQGDLEKAKRNFLKVVKRDNANEAAYKALAEIAEKNKRPLVAVWYWRNAARLNPLSRELHESYINSLLNTYQYGAIIKQLGTDDASRLSDFELYALTKSSYLRSPLNETKKLLEELLKRLPLPSKVVLLQADILFADGETKKASELFTSLKNDPDKDIRMNALLGLGHCEIVLSKIKEAGEFYKQAVEISSGRSIEASTAFANYNLRYGKKKIAEAEYRKLHERFPDNLNIILSLAEIYTEKKNAAAVKKLLDSVKTDNRAAVGARYYLKSLLAYIENDPAKLKENLKLCRMYSYRPLYSYLQLPEILVSNNIPDIRRQVERLLAINKSQAARDDLCKQLERLALENFKKKNFENAAALAGIIRELVPAKPAAVHLAMVCAYNQEQWRKAVSEADEFNKMRPDTLDYLSIKGCSLLYLREADKALPLLKKLTVLTPEKPEVWLWAAQAYQLLGRQQETEACVDKMLRFGKNSHAVIDPAVSFFLYLDNRKVTDKIASVLMRSGDGTLIAMAWSIKAQLAQKNGKWQDAVKYMLKAYGFKESSDALLYISDIYAENKKYDEALEYADKVLANEPDSPKALFRKAVILQERVNYDDAVKIYRELLKKYPKWSLVLVNLSDIMAARGEFREALQLAQDAQDEAPLWPLGKLCLARRQIDCGNYSTALRILETLVFQQPNDSNVKNAVSRCLPPIIKEYIKEKSFSAAKFRLEQLKKVTPGSKELADLEKLLAAGEAAAKKAAEK